MVAVVAPAVAAVFPGQFLRLNGWLKSLGIKAVFDVSFGAELTVKSYLDHLERNQPRAIIAQPCPALVSFIEIYHPELLPHLAPADSPMLHTIRMIREFHPEHARCKVVVLSPCAAKRREFDETGQGDYNVTFNGVLAELERRHTSLDRYPERDYDNPPAERAVLFSTPGGLLKTAERWKPEIGTVTRKVEGVHTVYPYLSGLGSSITKGHAPILVDCLNCEHGCNGGPGTPNQEANQDEMEYWVAERARTMRQRYEKENQGTESTVAGQVEEHVAAFWRPGLYSRRYVDRSRNNTIRRPTKMEQETIFKRMEKHQKQDVLDCGACGYGNCAEMAVAIHNGLNRSDNCHLFRQRRIERLLKNAEEMNRIAEAAESLGSAVEEMHSSVSEIARSATHATNESSASVDVARQAHAAMNQLKTSGDAIGDLAANISGVASQTRLLALNATIEAARAGDMGRGFAVVANEVKELARVTDETTKRIHREAQTISADTRQVAELIQSIMERTSQVGHSQSTIAVATQEQEAAVAEMSRQVHAIVAETQARVAHLTEMEFGSHGLSRAV